MGPSSSAGTPLIRMLARQSDGTRRRTLRPLVVGPALLRRPTDGGGPWRVDLADADGLVPHAPASRRDLRNVIALHGALGHICRLALALASPLDAVAHARPSGRDDRRAAADPPVPDIYGWSIMYRLPGQGTEAIVDPHDEHPGLPAFYDNPLEVVDRMAYLAARRIPHRVLALVTRPEDFERLDDHPAPRNRYYPQSRFARPVDISRLS